MQTLVSTRQARLDGMLFRSSVIGPSELAAALQPSGERELSLELHPLLHQLKFKHGQSFGDALVCNTSGFGKAFKLSGFKALGEDATSPALNCVTLKSFHDRGCFGRPQRWDIPSGCSKVHHLQGKHGALTVEDLLRGLISSLEDSCDECAAGYRHSRFEGWDSIRITDSEVVLERPIWGEGSE